MRSGPVSGQVFGYRPAVVANISERVEATAPLPMFNSYAAGVGMRLEIVVVSSRSMKSAKQVGPLRQVNPKGEELRVSVPFL